MKSIYLSFVIGLLVTKSVIAQVDSTFIYNSTMPYGTLDIRLAKSDTRYYYLKENETFSFRETSPGVKTNSFVDMTAWDSSPFTQGNLREKNGDQDLFIMNYRLLKPASYNASYAKGYPLIILFHGAGERGNCWKSNCYHATGAYNPNVNDPAAPTDPELELLNNDHHLIHGGRFYMDAINKAGAMLPDDPALPDGAFPGFALFPQSLNGWTGTESQDAIRIIRLLIKKYNIDPDRIYLTGLSNGAHGAFEALKRAPWMFASGIMMSAVDDGFITNTNMTAKVAHVPLWIFQGGLDTNPYPSETKNLIKKFRDAGAVMRYSEFANVGHTVWNSAFKEPDYFTWLLGYNKSKVHVFAGSTAICDATTGRILEMPEGFKAYQWQRDGQIIDGATAAKYSATSQGTYRGRFSRVASPSESQWNEWSDNIVLTTGSSPVASINQIGTVLLRDLNNGNQAKLEANGDFAHYYWYKNGVLLDLPGTQDDTLKQITISAGDCSSGACSGNGTYTLVTASFDNCKSPPSAPKYVYFNNQTPTNVPAPTEFKSTSSSASSIALSWKDNASNEIGYEIWRREKISETAFSSWEMPGLTAANAASFTDINLIPQRTYQYKIRAVSTAARSAYTPADGALEAVTTPDTQAPAAPTNLTATRTGVDQVALKWKPATDNSAIAEYHVSYHDQILVVNGADTTAVVSGLAPNTEYNFKVAAKDMSGNMGPASNEVQVNTTIAGLFYTHSPGDKSTLDSVDFSKPEKSGIIANFLLTPKVQEDFFWFRFDGFLFLTTSGNYEFRLTSDDGSRLTLDGSRIIDNDGINALVSGASSAQALAEGAHRITVDYFDHTGKDSLLVEYKGPDTESAWMRIPSSALKSSIDAVVSVEPAVDPAFDVSVYPNPSSGMDVSVQVQTDRDGPVSVMMIDAVGRKISSAAYNADEVRNGMRITSSSVKPGAGIYFIRVEQDGRVIQKKLVIRN
jgi:chitodextrinase